MNWDKMNKLMVIIFSIFLFFLFPATGWAPVLPPEEYFFEEGKEALEHQDLSGAYYSFEDALSINPDHPGANFFYALTRVLMISQSTNFNNLLTRAGMSTSGRDIFNWTADFKRDARGNIVLPSGSPTGKELQDFLKKDVLPQINGALDNLTNVGNTYTADFKWIVENGLGVVNSPNLLIDITKSWMPDEWKDYELMIDGVKYSITGNTENMIYVSPTWVTSPPATSPGTHIYDIFGNVEIDYGDVLVLKGFLYLAKAGILTLSSYDLNIDIDAIVSSYNAGKLTIQNNIINTYKNFLNLLATQQLSEAISAFREGLNILNQAINFITTELDSQEDDLIIINPEDKQPYLELLADLNSALDGTTLIRKIGLDVNLEEFFDYPKNLRGYLPTFLGPYQDGSIFIKRDSFPDPTFGGILPNMTREELQSRLEEHIRDSFPITPLVLYDNFSAPKIDTNRWRGGELVREIIKTGDYVYDDFSGANIDNKKWKQGNSVREIQGGKAVFKQASPNPIAVSTPYGESDWLGLPYPNSVNSIQADVTVLENSATNSARARARLAGTWYLGGTPGQGLTGDIWANVELRQTSTGLFAQWGIARCTDKDCKTSDYGRSGIFSTPISLGKTYTLYIEYDNAKRRFIFRVNNDQIIFDAPDLPVKLGDAVNPTKGIGTRVEIDDPTSSGYISATFDSVYQNGSPYDNFSLPTIDPAKWITYENVREIKGGKFRSKVRSDEPYNSNSFVGGVIDFEIPTTINAFQAKVTPLIYQNPQGLDQIQYQMAGIYRGGYNDGSGTGTPGDRTGDVFGNLRIGGKEAKPTAEWEIIRYVKDPQTSEIIPGIIDSGKFNTLISLGTTYTLFVGWDGTKFTFKFNNEPPVNYTPKTAVNPIKVPFAGLGTRIFPKGTKEGSIEALFDDVTVIVGSDYKLLSKSASPNASTVSVSPYYNADNQLYFPDPNSVNSIGADVMILENITTGKAHTRARLAGFWYNDNTTPGAGSGAIGDVQGEIALRKEPTGFRVNWFIVRMTNEKGTTGDYITGGDFKAGVTTGVAYPLYISYNSSTNEFKFKVGDEEVIVNKTNTPNLPNRSGPANTGWKEIATRVQIQDPGASGYISATFDNVYKNDVLYDAFPPPAIGSPTINDSKWTTYESVREISSGKFRSKIRSSSVSTSASVQSSLDFLYPSEISAIQTKVTPLVFQNDERTSPRARVAGTFYNEGTRSADPKDRTGDVGAQVRIGGSGLNPVAEWVVWRTIDFAGAVPEVIASGIFNTPISVGGPYKTYTLFLGWDGIQFTFKIDNEVAYFAPGTGVYQTNNPWRAIETQIFDPKGKEATMEALFDDVMVSGPLPSVSPQSYDFGKVIAPTISPVQTFTLSNNGSTNIGIESIDLVGADASMFDIVSTTCPAPSSTLPPKGKCNIVASFQPTSEGEKSAALRFTLNTRGNPAILMPLKGTGLLEKISTPATPIGLTPGTTGTTYTFTTGGSSSSLGPTHSIQYLFDWDDGTNSGWLPVGKTSASKIWTSSGTYTVKAMARCATHKPVVSSLSSSKTVDITIPIHPTSPPIGSPYNVSSLYACSSISIPTFGWTPSEYLTRYEIQFSTDYKFRSIKVKVPVPTPATSAAITKPVWQSILAIPGKSGGVVYWRVVGTRSNATTATSETSFILVGGPQPVLDAKFLHTSKTATPPPTLTWRNNYNKQFKVYVANDPDFSKPGIKKYVSPVLSDDPCADGGMFNGPLTSGYWASVYGVVNGVVGSPIYWYVESTDILGRSAKTAVMSFVLQP